jgi:hypothetical protein
MSDFIDSDIRFSIVPEWVLDAGLSDRGIRIYALIARYADNDTLQAFPSRETLADRALCSVKSVDRAISELVAAGALRKAHRRNGDSYQSNLYTVRRIPDPLVTRVAPPRDTGDARVGTVVSPGRDTGVPLTRTTELEPNQLEPVNDINEQFNQFWAIYPRKKGKGQAIKAFEKALLKTDLETIVAGVQAYMEHEDMCDPQFIAHPTTWLNGERWEDEYEETRVVTKSPHVGGPRDWVQDMHDMGEHFECREGEFGCK